MSYRLTPLSHGYSPAELFMGRRLRTTVPMLPEDLVPRPIPWEEVVWKDQTTRAKQKEQFDQGHRVKELPTLEPGDTVYIPDRKETGRIITETAYPRSYFIATSSGTVRRNRRKLVLLNQIDDGLVSLADYPNHDQNQQQTDQSEQEIPRNGNAGSATHPTQVPVMARSGRQIRQPASYRDL